MSFSDFLTFEKFVAPMLIKIVYWIGLLLIVIGFLGSLFGGGFGMMSGFGGFILKVIGTLLGLLMWRVICELWIVVFSINDRLGRIADKA